MRRSCFSISGSHQHGPPLLSRVRTPPRSPTSALLCSPPTPSPPSAAAPVVPRQRPTPARRSCSSPSHRRLRLPGQRRRHFYPGSPLAGSVPRRDKGLPGAWAILFVRAVLFDPAGCDAPLAPLTVRSPSPSGPPRPSAPGMHSISGLSCPRPTRSRAYASPKPLPSPAQGSLPAGRAHPWPGGFRTRWMTNKVSWCHRIRQSSSTSLAWSHRRRESIRPWPNTEALRGGVVMVEGIDFFAVSASWRDESIGGEHETHARRGAGKMTRRPPPARSACVALAGTAC